MAIDSKHVIQEVTAMVPIGMRWLAAALVSALTGCASVQELTQNVEAKAVCCKSMAEFVYEPLARQDPQPFALDETSPVYAFESGKSYFKAYLLPPSTGVRMLTVRSFVTGSAAFEPRTLSQVFCPQATFLDADYKMLQSASRIPDFARGAGLTSEFGVPALAKYVVLHANPSNYGAFATRYTSGGAYMVGRAIVVEQGGEPVGHPCAPIADARVEVR